MESVKAKNGYSIWLLLVFMTLLGLLMAIPKLIALSSVRDNASEIFFVCHQLCMWCSCGTLVWLASGKNRIVLSLCVLSIMACWLPAIVIVTEMVVRNSPPQYMDWLLKQVMLYDAYQTFYDILWETSGPYE
ncbi:MAG: hypothetical protein IT423_00370 [Pirellulaceae bacterium]|nr:hypothetical protein [Pirellulaceae bacterium]